MENKKWYVGQKVWDKTLSDEAGKVVYVETIEQIDFSVRVVIKDKMWYYSLDGSRDPFIFPTLSTTPYEIKMEGFSQEVEKELPKIGDVCWSKIDKNEDWAITHFLRKQSTHYLVSSTNSEKDSYPCNFITTKNPYEVEQEDRKPKVGDLVFVWDKTEPITVLSGILHDIIDSKFKIKGALQFTYKHCSLKNPLIK